MIITAHMSMTSVAYHRHLNLDADIAERKSLFLNGFSDDSKSILQVKAGTMGIVSRICHCQCYGLR